MWPLTRSRRNGPLWSKMHIVWQDKRHLNIKICLCLLASSLPPTVHCICALYIDQILSIVRNTCSNIKSNILLTSINNSLKYNFFQCFQHLSWNQKMIVVEKELNYKTHFVNFYFLLDIKPVIYFSFVSSSMSWGRFYFIFSCSFLLLFDKRVGSNWIVHHS